jgi:FkbM family methyltransferase
MKTFVQIGANKGNDTFYKRMCDLQEPATIVLVEANPNLIPELQVCYYSLRMLHNVLVFNNGIVHDTGVDTLIPHFGSDGLSSVLTRKSHPYPLEAIKFHPLTFAELCSAAKVSFVDELHIDTEGYDYTILNSIDFDAFPIPYIECEVWPFDVDSTDSIKTGPKYFNEVLKPKMERYYSIGSKVVDEMATHVFVRK